MERRLKLHSEFLELLKSRNGKAYHQPPESVKMVYPAIIYHLNDVQTIHADDLRYVKHKRYMVMYVTNNPDDDFTNEMLEHFKYCTFDRRYVMDNLYHFVFDLYY